MALLGVGIVQNGMLTKYFPIVLSSFFLVYLLTVHLVLET